MRLFNDYVGKHNIYILLITTTIVYCIVLFTAKIPQYFNSSEFLCPDSFSYLKAANLFPVSHPTRPFLYPIILKLLSLNNTDLFFIHFSGVIINFCFWTGVNIYLYKLSSEILSEKYSFFVTLFFSINVGVILISFQLLPEVIFMYLIIYFIYRIKVFIGNMIFKNILIINFICGLMVLLKPAAFYLLIILFLYTIYFISNMKMHKIKYLLWIFSIHSFLLLPQIISNLIYYKTPVISNISSLALYCYFDAHCESLSSGINLRTVINKRSENLERLIPKNVDYWKNVQQLAKNDFLFQLENNSSNVIKAFVTDIIKNGYFGSNFAKMENSSTFLYKVSQMQNIIHSIIFLIWTYYIILYLIKNEKSVNRESFLFSVIIYIVCLYFILVSGLSFFQGDRFNLILFPSIWVGFSCFINKIHRKHYGDY